MAQCVQQRPCVRRSEPCEFLRADGPVWSYSRPSNWNFWWQTPAAAPSPAISLQPHEAQAAPRSRPMTSLHSDKDPSLDLTSLTTQ